MPTSQFQCEVFMWNEEKTEKVQCVKIFPEHASIKDLQVSYQNHLEIHRMNGNFLSHETSSDVKVPAAAIKGSKMKVTQCPKWIKEQTYESFERDFQSWQRCSDLTQEQEKSLLIEMLKVCETSDVKDYYA